LSQVIFISYPFRSFWEYRPFAGEQKTTCRKEVSMPAN
jgi:hypothetical protein